MFAYPLSCASQSNCLESKVSNWLIRQNQQFSYCRLFCQRGNTFTRHRRIPTALNQNELRDAEEVEQQENSEEVDEPDG